MDFLLKINISISFNNLWTSVFHVFSCICKITIQPNLFMAIFEHRLSLYQLKTIAFASLLAR